jgi:hypothetical protein
MLTKKCSIQKIVKISGAMKNTQVFDTGRPVITFIIRTQFSMIRQQAQLKCGKLT